MLCNALVFSHDTAVVIELVIHCSKVYNILCYLSWVISLCSLVYNVRQSSKVFYRLLLLRGCVEVESRLVEALISMPSSFIFLSTEQILAVKQVIKNILDMLKITCPESM